MPLIEVEREGALARVWFNRPEAHNALSAEVGAELATTVHALAHDDAVRCVVLGGRGPSFCAGADIGAMKASANATFDQNLVEAEKLGNMFAALADFPKPVVGRLHGGVYGGGVGGACASDHAGAGDHAKFGQTEGRRGLVPRQK